MNEAEQGAKDIGKMLDEMDGTKSFEPLNGKLYHLKENMDGVIDKPLFDGKVDDGSQYGMQFKVIETIDSKGNQIVYLYKKIGAVWSGEGKHPNLLMSGTVDAGIFGDEERDISMWKNTSDDGEEWVSVKVDNKYKKPE
jgi:uncharacterized protein YlzI (FlbEa/FlbD family)